MSTQDEAFIQTLGPNEWPVENFDTPPTDAEWSAVDDLESQGAFDGASW